MLGTAALEIGDRREPNPEHATTPEAPRLQAILRAMVTAGDRAAVVETTSHGLALERVAGIRYDVAILTNITHEHLELHGSWEAYRDAKRSLFDRLAVGPENPPKPSPGWPRTGIVNADGSVGGSHRRRDPPGGCAGPHLHGRSVPLAGRRAGHGHPR